MNSVDGQVYSVCILKFFVLLSTTVCSQNLNKKNVNIADETLTDYSFLSRHHYTKSQEFILKDDIKFVTEFSCLLGHPEEYSSLFIHIYLEVCINILTGLPKKDETQRRLYRIYLIRFLEFRVPCRLKLTYFCAETFRKQSNYSFE